jgi:hypothetical protein
MDPEFATLEAECLVRDRGIGSLPIDPFQIAYSAGIEVCAKPANTGVSGMLIRSGSAFAIAYATSVPSEGFQRFSIAHELGHYFLRGHVDHVLGTNGLHESRAGFLSRDRYEIEADQFAAGLLMPRSLFVRALSSAGEGLDAVEYLAAECKTSLTATAIRYVEFTTEAAAIVVSNPSRIEYCCLTKRFRDLPGLVWPKRDEPIPRRTATYRFSADPGRIIHAEREEDTVNLREWFGGGPDLPLVEQVIGLGTYSRILTVLTVDEARDEDEAEEDKALARSWTPALSRSRRR